MALQATDQTAPKARHASLVLQGGLEKEDGDCYVASQEQKDTRIRTKQRKVVLKLGGRVWMCLDILEK